MFRKFEGIVAERVVCIVGPPPGNIDFKLEFLTAILYDWAAPHHERKGGKKSYLYQDLKSLATIVNGDVTQEAWQHYCWNPETRGPCCESAQETAERTTVACVNAFLVEGDPVPAESR